MGRVRVFIVYLGVAAFAAPARLVSGFDLREFRRLPVSVSGRVQPIDTLARLALLRITGSGSVSVDGSGNQRQAGSLDADEWLLEILAKPDVDTRAGSCLWMTRWPASSRSARKAGPSSTHSASCPAKWKRLGNRRSGLGKLKAGDSSGVGNRTAPAAKQARCLRALEE